MTSFLNKTFGFMDLMRISLEDKQVEGIEELTGKKLSKNGNELVSEVIEMAKAGNNELEKEIEVCDFTNKMASEEKV